MTNKNDDPPRQVGGDDKETVVVAYTGVVLLGGDCGGGASDPNEPKELAKYDDDVDMSSFKTYSILLGGLIGCFIQISSLAANYYLQTNSSTATTTPNSLGLSVAWSFLTSTLGVVLMLGVRSLLVNNDRHKIYLEGYFAAGALIGVCLAWMGTDVALGMHQHMIHSGFTLVLAVGWCKILCLFFPVEMDDNDDDSNNNRSESSLKEQDDLSSYDLEKPLLLESNEGKEDATDTNKTLCSFRVKTTGLFLGCIVGLFIQFSSLGANFFCQERLCDITTRSSPVAFSLIWSFITSSMGIVVLILIRGLLVTTWSSNSSNKHAIVDDDSNSDDQSFLWLLHVECFFALGATLGLNVAWTVTDMAFGLESHIWQSVGTLVGTLIWCKLVMFCCGYSRTTEE